MIGKILRFIAVVATGVTLSTGFVSANSATIDTTGPHSRNSVEFRNRDSVRVTNNNNVSVRNNNPQSASTGEAKVRNNTTGGDATSGDASNDSLLRATLTLDNSSCSCMQSNGSGDSSGDISNTGPNSSNHIVFNNSSHVTMTNNNNVSVENNNSQSASSGNASVSGNTTGGSATSGNASNISTTEVNLNITN